MLEKKVKMHFMLTHCQKHFYDFRQGFGRLIRTSTDRGVLVVLDRRIITSKYGIEFQKALPPVKWEEVSINEMARCY